METKGKFNGRLFFLSLVSHHQSQTKASGCTFNTVSLFQRKQQSFFVFVFYFSLEITVQTTYKAKKPNDFGSIEFPLFWFTQLLALINARAITVINS